MLKIIDTGVHYFWKEIQNMDKNKEINFLSFAFKKIDVSGMKLYL